MLKRAAKQRRAGVANRIARERDRLERAFLGRDAREGGCARRSREKMAEEDESGPLTTTTADLRRRRTRTCGDPSGPSGESKKVCERTPSFSWAAMLARVVWRIGGRPEGGSNGMYSP